MEAERLSPSLLKSLPKVDLHRHLEGSLRLNTLLEIAQGYGLDLPAIDSERLRPHVQMHNDPFNMVTFLGKFQVLRSFYRSPEAVKRLAYEAVEDAARDNIHYLELRFAPQALARVRGFAFAEVTDWVIEATRQAGEDFNVMVGLIITLVRHDPLEQSRRVVEVACERVGKGIVGIDLAGNEVKFPPSPFRPIFDRAKEAGLGITIHSGEWGNAYGIQQVIEELHADRIGHGVRSVENSSIIHLLRERQVALEICLTSNLQTGVIHSVKHHPLVDLHDLGVMTTLNSDDPSISDCTLTDEFQMAHEALGMGYQDLRQIILNGAKAAFLPPAQKRALVSYFEQQLPHRPPKRPLWQSQPSISIPNLALPAV